MTELPFTTEEFLQLFASYNEAIWPAQIVAYILGVLVIYLILTRYRRHEGFVNVLMGFFWLWMGLVYHISFFTGINPVAYIFGSFFIVQGILFLLLNRLGYSLGYAYSNNGYSHTGSLLIFYAMVIYPLLGIAFGHSYPESPVFGVAPCPTAIFTFGILLWAQNKLPVWLVAIPFIWSLIGISAALQLSIFEDIGLPVAGLISLVLILYRNYKLQKQEAPISIEAKHETL